MVKKDAKQKKVRITNCETCAFTHMMTSMDIMSVRQISTRTRCPRSSAEVTFPAVFTRQMMSTLL